MLAAVTVLQSQWMGPLFAMQTTLYWKPGHQINEGAARWQGRKIDCSTHSVLDIGLNHIADCCVE